MTALSKNTFPVSSQYFNNDLYIPFKIFARMVQNSANPFAGNRWERIRAEEKVANLIEMSLRDLVRNGRSTTDETDDYEFEFAFPVAFTRQFGNEPSRITIIGHIKGDRDPTGTDDALVPPKKVAADINQINANEAESGQGAFNAANLDPHSEIDNLARELLDLFSDSTQIQFIDRVDIMSIEVSGILYGRRGRHFPSS
jgi:hypothetical protein